MWNSPHYVYQITHQPRPHTHTHTLTSCCVYIRTSICSYLTRCVVLGPSPDKRWRYLGHHEIGDFNRCCHGRQESEAADVVISGVTCIAEMWEVGLFCVLRWSLSDRITSWETELRAKTLHSAAMWKQITVQLQLLIVTVCLLVFIKAGIRSQAKVRGRATSPVKVNVISR